MGAGDLLQARGKRGPIVAGMPRSLTSQLRRRNIAISMKRLESNSRRPARRARP